MPYFCSMRDSAFLQQLFAGEQVFLIPEPDDVSPEIPVPAAAAPVVAAEQPVEEPVAEAPVAAPVPDPIPATPVAEPLPAAFRHQVLILVDNPSAEDLTLLENILKAVNLSLDSVELLDLAKVAGLRYKELLNDQYLHHLLSFGVPLKKVGLQIFLMPYQARQVEGVQFLLVDPLQDIQADKDKKKALWRVLKQLFTI
ncbi:DNA polymerase III, psi subunit [Siphonobacter aquaeclarae]|uniref:DNA polymerase III, psi subunit n=2 Tax=Siphonobacter aquaeclarae TaxID=563176 RepID=A0A1G9KRZ8_9BACT|nr:DNA polymerase III, psi subunit [Siphonobacter aquaeclarae]